MNKISIIVIVALLLSMGLLWYKASTPPAKKSLDNAQLVVGVNAEYPPFVFIKDDKIVGFDIDLIEEIAKHLNKQLELRNMSFDSLIPGLQTGTLQIVVGGMTPTQERTQRVFFTKPYLSADPLTIISLADSPLSTTQELRNKIVAVNEGYTADYYMSTIPDIQLLRLATPLEAFMALQSKRANAFVSAANAAAPFLAHYKDKFRTAVIPDTSETYAITISKKYPDLVEPIQHALDALQEDGFIDALKQKWQIA